MIDRASFELQVQEALAHVYDLPFLQRSPLLQCLGRRAPGVTGGKALHGALIEAIEQLKPPPEVSPEAIIWRIYRTLVLRYVRSLNAAAAARELGLSTRQAQRIHGIAVATVATTLWESWGLGDPRPGESVMPDSVDHPAAPDKVVADDPGSPSLDDELAAILAGDHGEFEAFRTTLRGAIETINPVLRQREISIELMIDEALSHRIVPHGLTRQALVQILLGTSTFVASGTLTVVGQHHAFGAYLAIAARATDPTRSLHFDQQSFRERMKIAERILDAVGGKVRVFPPPEARIEVDLPLDLSPTILFVEDNPQVVQLFRRYLTGTIYRFLHAPDAESVLGLAARQQPSVISLDVMMPRRDGWELLQALKVDPRTRDIPVIVCSVLRDHELALALGAAEFLPKPVSQSALLGALNRHAIALLRPEVRTPQGS